MEILSCKECHSWVYEHFRTKVDLVRLRVALLESSRTKVEIRGVPDIQLLARSLDH